MGTTFTLEVHESHLSLLSHVSRDFSGHFDSDTLDGSELLECLSELGLIHSLQQILHKYICFFDLACEIDLVPVFLFHGPVDFYLVLHDL